MELLADDVVLQGDGCEFLGYRAKLVGDGHQPFDELGEEGDGGEFGRDESFQGFPTEVQEILRIEAEGGSCLGQLVCHAGDGAVRKRGGRL